MLGLPRRYDIDLERLQRRFVELARLVHPDYFADCGPEGRLAAMHNSARINQAYQTLRDPLGRAEYLLELSGGKSSSEDRSVPGDLLGQMMMLREQIEQAKADGDQQALSRLKEQILRRQAGLQQRIARLARRLGQQPADQELLDELRRQLNAVRYVNNLLSAF
ncbi:MAG: Fe-S protein assembly co-chaperone HscB [Phycisphaerae bacterium]